MKKMVFCLFFLYCIILMSLVFLGRKADASLSAAEYFLMYSNIFPFRTLTRYIFCFWKRKDLPSLRLALLNIGGNLVLFLPMGMLLPILFPELRNARKCFLVTLGIVLLVELLQGLLRIGIPDIDDLIVNMAGACAGMGIGRKLARALS